MRIIKYLKNSKLAVVLVLCLLIVQAATDLALPNYTSQIVDVGIQQSGIEHAAVEEMSSETFQEIAMMLSEDNEEVFRDSYTQSDSGTYQINQEGLSNQEELDSIIALPLVVIYYSDTLGSIDLDQLLASYQAGDIQKQDVLDAVNQAVEEMGGVDDSILEQQALLAAQDIYEQLGYDVADIQMDYLIRMGVTMLAIAALGMLVSVCVGFIASRTAAKIGASLRAQLFKQVVTFSNAEVQSFSAASLITRGTNDIQLIQMVIVMILRMVLLSPILAIGGIVMISQTSFEMSWIILVAVLCVFVLISFLLFVAMPKFKMMQKLIDRVNLVSREKLTGLNVIRAFDRQDYEQTRFNEASLNLMNTQLFTNRVMTFMMPCMMLIMNATSVAIVWFGGSLVDAGSVQTGDLIAFITYSMVIIMSFLILGMMSIMLPRAGVAAQRIDEVLEARPSICDPDGIAQDNLLEHAQGGVSIAFNDVSFRYGDSKACVLENINFVAQTGKTTAIIGSTGSGKSTIIKLIERFHDVSEGSITLDGVDVRSISQKTLRSQVAYVPQEAFLFRGTITSNIAYSDESMENQRIEWAAEIAQARPFIEEKDEGFQSPISQGGTNVSGGQRQRLAIARALASSARAYLFDDSFSALDYKTDAALRKQLTERLNDKTVIIVAQRISTVMNADLIIVLDEGRMVGKGTHEDLMASCGSYREIALSQLSEAELKGGEAL